MHFQSLIRIIQVNDPFALWPYSSSFGPLCDWLSIKKKLFLYSRMKISPRFL